MLPWEKPLPDMVDRFNVKIIYVAYINKHKSQTEKFGTKHQLL